MYSLEEDPVQELILEGHDGFCYAHINELTFKGVYQPIFNKELVIVGFEGLTRITTVNGDAISPEQYFKGIGDDNNAQLFNFILCTKIHLNNFSRFAKKTDMIFVNIHPTVFNFLGKNPSACQKLLQGLNRLNISPTQLVYEITEDYNPNPAETNSGIKILDDHGIKTALDDFGTLFCDIKRVKTTKTTFIKVDRSITQDLNCHTMQIRTLLQYKSNSDVQLLAEGIETKEQLDAAIDIGFDLFQGYFLGRPSPSTTWLNHKT